MALRLRRARPADALPLARLRWEFRAAQDRPNEGRARFVRRCAAWMRAALARRTAWVAWVASDGATIVGHVWVGVVEKIPNPVAEAERHAYVTNVYVAPAHRGAGLGGRLMAAALAWCDAHAIDSIVLWPTAKSRRLYGRHGFAAPPTLLERRGR